ncbi:MAG: type II toxin-antitoxin system VapC family toxin [Candidatus Binatia bacterium]
MAFLLDTNVLSELRKGERCNASVRRWFLAVDADDLYVSVLVIGEIRRGIELLRRRDLPAATALDRWLSELERRFADHILPVTLEVCRVWGGMSLARPLAPIDGLLAATAVHHGMTLVTRNVGDVARSGAAVVDPFAPG